MTGIVLGADIEKGLLDAGYSPEQVNALKTAMANSGVDPYAESYAHGMRAAWDEFPNERLNAIHTQILYLMNNMQKWKGEEARETKKILKKWKDLSK